MSGFLSSVTSAVGAVSGLASLAFGAAGGVVLDTFAFSGFEVPEYINVPGSHQLVVHKLPGGERVIHAMGDDPGDISWSGMFIDGDPDRRAQELEQMRKAPRPVALQWGTYLYTVVIRSVEIKPHYGRVQYSITCAVLHNGPVNPPAATSQTLAEGGISGALSSISTGLGQAADAVHNVISVANQVLPLAGALGLHVRFLGQAQEALGLAAGFAGQVGSTAAYGNATSNSISAMQSGAAASYGGASALGGIVGAIATGAPSGQLVSGPVDLQTVTYAAGGEAQMQQAGGFAGAGAVSAAATNGQSASDAVAAQAPSSYVDPTPLASIGPPNSFLGFTSNVINTSGDPTQGLYMKKSILYGSNGSGTVTLSVQASVPGQLTAADASAAGF